MCPALLTKQRKRQRARDTHITEHFPKKKPEVLHTKDQKDACKNISKKQKQTKKSDNMDARPVTDSNSLAPYETLCAVSGMFLIC